MGLGELKDILSDVDADLAADAGLVAKLKAWKRGG